ncbi:MAG: ribonuclease P protein component [Candidatus Wildermuthbacteria bacterium]|nr:ribonuclease P protein component [Candidatus Wildermuthbacteria bacterium]
MLPQAARLRKTKDFKEVFGKGGGTRFGRLFLKARAVKNKNTRFGIVVSKQVAAKATDRNRIKRLLREAVKSCLPDIKEGHDIVLVTLPGFTAANLKEAQTQVIGIIKKSSLFKS